MAKHRHPDRLDDREKSRLSEDLDVTSWEEPGSFSLLNDDTEATGFLAGADLDDDAGGEGPSEGEAGVGTADEDSIDNTAGWVDTEIGRRYDREQQLPQSTDITGRVRGAGPGFGTSTPLDTTREGFEPRIEGETYEVDPEIAATDAERDEVPQKKK